MAAAETKGYSAEEYIDGDERPLGPADALRVEGELGARRGDEWLDAEEDMVVAMEEETIESEGCFL